EIITALTKIEGLRVAARTSAFAFKGKRESVSEIGRQLRVGTVLEGSVRRAGDRLRVTAQLVNVKDGYHLWAEAYDRDLRDVFAVRSEEHTSELQSLAYLVCRLLLEKKKFDNKASTR